MPIRDSAHVRYLRQICSGHPPASHEAIYQDLSADKAAAETKISAQRIQHWCRDYEHVVGEGMIKYIRAQLKKTVNDPFGYFISCQFHKTPSSTVLLIEK
eukprot:scaffold296400_cov79-Cyclotella_meneghiniana.AAC.1